jgi:plastocyanin
MLNHNYQRKNFEPKEARGTLGINNKIIWTNTDTTAHSVTSDNQYKDQINGPFNSIDSIGLVLPQKTFEFTFTKDGEYAYHCEPHPWMTGKVIIVKSFV